jgi:agmatine deiminase
MPAEWEPQEAIWLAWPHNELTWPDGMLAQVESTYIQIIHALHSGQKIKLLVTDPRAEERVRERLGKSHVELSQVDFYQIEYQDSWIRDYGPTFIVNRDSQQLAMVKWRFNAWGNKYEDLLADDTVPYDLNRHLGLRMFEAGIVLEGGSIDVNGAGIVLTTEQCLLNKNRNPDLSRSEIERYLQEFLNISEVVWLKEGIAGDDTDGHIDDIARFVGQDKVVCAFAQDDSVLQENYDILAARFTEVLRLPMPAATGLPASYANFYIGNRAVIVPLFDDPNDGAAVDTLRQCFPERKIVGVPSSIMVHGLGTVHCCSQQHPRP